MKGKIAMYSLKLFNNTLVKFDMENKPTLKIFNINVVSNDKKLFPEAIQNEVNSNTLKEFLQQRVVPKNRTFVKNILETWHQSPRHILRDGTAWGQLASGFIAPGELLKVKG